jgi:hypothetical protein
MVENPTCIKVSVGRTATTICAEREQMAEDYRVCVDQFRFSVSALRNLLGAEFDRAYETSEKHRVAVEKARTGLERHRAEHRC